MYVERDKHCIDIIKSYLKKLNNNYCQLNYMGISRFSLQLKIIYIKHTQIFGNSKESKAYSRYYCSQSIYMSEYSDVNVIIGLHFCAYVCWRVYYTSTV